MAFVRTTDTEALGGKGSGAGVTFKTFTLNGRRGGTFSFRKISVKFPPRAVNGRYEVRIEQSDPRVAIWDLNIESWRSQACSIANRSLSLLEWRQFVGADASYRPTCADLRPAITH